MTARLFTLLIAVAYRRARRVGGQLWWVVIALAIFARYVDNREPFRLRRRWRVRDGNDLHVNLSSRSTR